MRDDRPLRFRFGFGTSATGQGGCCGYTTDADQPAEQGPFGQAAIIRWRSLNRD